jgi:hypothetical protein
LAARHRHQEWLAFLKTIDAETPADLDIHTPFGVRSNNSAPRSSSSAPICRLSGGWDMFRRA